ncbi:MAG TPA: tyramine oxidase, partial [Streptosporangiaceae bacterium]|nr:tyramine oxidase [Streptosporangiaceae bacterium]
MTAHPYDPLTEPETEQAVAAVRQARPELTAPRFPLIRTAPPAKAAVRDYDPADPPARQAFLVVYDREPGATSGATFEAIVDLQAGKVTSWRHIPGVQPAIMIEEIMALDEIVRNDPAAVAALRRHGVTDLELLQIDPWSTGTLPVEGVDVRRRIVRASAYVRRFREDNGYARPVGNLVFVIDCDDRKVAAIIDGEPVPLPPEDGNYDAATVGTLRRS